jgi:hypothetical protein
LQWQASPRQSQSTLHLPGIAELRYACCRCRKFDPVGDWRGIGQSCVGCGISAGCSSAWSWTCFGHEQRWKPKSWCSNSRSSCCDGASRASTRFFAHFPDRRSGPCHGNRTDPASIRAVCAFIRITLSALRIDSHRRKCSRVLGLWRRGVTVCCFARIR